MIFTKSLCFHALLTALTVLMAFFKRALSFYVLQMSFTSLPLSLSKKWIYHEEMLTGYIVRMTLPPQSYMGLHYMHDTMHSPTPPPPYTAYYAPPQRYHAEKAPPPQVCTAYYAPPTRVSCRECLPPSM
jgi:hypothetical protein